MRFPHIHLATSVVNRIRMLDKQINPAPSKPPSVPDPSAQGLALDQQLATPPEPVPAPEGSEEAVATEQMQGGSAADAVASIGILDAMQ